tara:strand:- start:26422 stop:27399 length:978 start_codon:yes stop_codon:yes gene_type:complete
MMARAHPVVLTFLANFLIEQGYEPSEQLRAYDGPTIFDPDAVGTVPAKSVFHALDESVRHTGDSNLILNFAKWLDVRAFGPIAVLYEFCPNLGYVFNRAKQFIPIVNSAYTFDVILIDEEAHVIQTVLPSLVSDADQFLFGAQVFIVRLIRQIFGNHWKPLRVEMRHQFAGDNRLLQSFFRCPVEITPGHNSILIDRYDLERSFPRHDSGMLAYLEADSKKLLSRIPSSFDIQVERFVASRLGVGSTTLKDTAAHFRISVRTLQRELKNSGTSFSNILNKVRRETCDAYFRNSSKASVSELTYILGYSDISTTSRFLVNAKVRRG